MDERLEKLEEDIKDIKVKLDLIYSLLDKQSKSSKKMDEHIDFVEQTYSTLRSPLNYIKSTYDRITGNESESLPLRIENNST